MLTPHCSVVRRGPGQPVTLTHLDGPAAQGVPLPHPHAGGKERHGLGAARKVVQQHPDEASLSDVGAVGLGRRVACRALGGGRVSRPAAAAGRGCCIRRCGEAARARAVRTLAAPCGERKRCRCTAHRLTGVEPLRADLAEGEDDADDAPPEHVVLQQAQPHALELRRGEAEPARSWAPGPQLGRGCRCT